MAEHESEPVRRLRAVRFDGPATPPRETAETVLPGLPRVGALDSLLREVDSLRLTLETDLTLAASAVAVGSVGIARDIIDSDRASLRTFETAALGHLSDLSAQDRAAARTWWRRIPAAPFVAAAAVVGFLIGVVPQLSGPPTSSISANQASARSSLDELSKLAASGRTAEVRSAAQSLHNQLQALVLQASTDPAAARQGLLLLSAERSIIADSGDSQALRDVLAASTRLSNQIFQALPLAVRPTTPAVTARPVIVPTTKPTSSPTPTASSKPTTKASSQPTPKPSSSPRPSSSPSGSNVLPTGPKVGP